MASSWQPTHADPVFILAMDHRDSFGANLFGVRDGDPTAPQLQRIRHAKVLIFSALDAVDSDVAAGRAAVLVDERYGQPVIDRARTTPVVLAIPVEASGQDWFGLGWGNRWLEHVEAVAPDYAKVLVRDNSDFDQLARSKQLESLAEVCAALDGIGVPLLYELLVPASDRQLQSVANSTERYDRDVRPELTARLIADNQQAGVFPGLWKLEGFDTADAARSVAAQTRSGERPADVVLLGRDAPMHQLDHWIDVAADVDTFVGFAIGRSIWEEPLRDFLEGDTDAEALVARIGERYLHFVHRWLGVSPPMVG